MTSTKQMTNEETRQHILGGLSITGMSFVEVVDVLNNEGQNLPSVIFNKVRPTVYEWGQNISKREEAYIIADVEQNEPEKKRLREQQFLSDMNVVNALMYHGASHIIEKMQNEAVKHTRPNKAGRKFNMFHAINHNAVYYPNDVELLHRQGFNFDRPNIINGKKVDFTQYNIDMLDIGNNLFEKSVNNLIKTVQQSNTQNNTPIEQQITHYRMNAEANMQDFISCRQRLLKALELNCVSPENIQKIQNVDFDSKIQRLQSNYIRFKQTTNLLDNNEQQPHIADTKPFTNTDAQNNTLASASNNEPTDKTNIQVVQKQQLGVTVNSENEERAINQSQQATKA